MAERLADYTTLKVGGLANIVHAQTEAEIIKAIIDAADKEILILGGGSKHGSPLMMVFTGRLARRAVAITALALTALTSLASALAPNLFTLFATRAFAALRVAAPADPVRDALAGGLKNPAAVNDAHAQMVTGLQDAWKTPAKGAA